MKIREKLRILWKARTINLDDLFTNDPQEAEQPANENIVWEPMPQYGETEADRIYWRARG